MKLTATSALLAALFAVMAVPSLALPIPAAPSFESQLEGFGRPGCDNILCDDWARRPKHSRADRPMVPAAVKAREMRPENFAPPPDYALTSHYRVQVSGPGQGDRDRETTESGATHVQVTKEEAERRQREGAKSATAPAPHARSGDWEHGKGKRPGKGSAEELAAHYVGGPSQMFNRVDVMRARADLLGKDAPPKKTYEDVMREGPTKPPSSKDTTTPQWELPLPGAYRHDYGFPSLDRPKPVEFTQNRRGSLPVPEHVYWQARADLLALDAESRKAIEGAEERVAKRSKSEKPTASPADDPYFLIPQLHRPKPGAYHLDQLNPSPNRPKPFEIRQNRRGSLPVPKDVYWQARADLLGRDAPPKKTYEDWLKENATKPLSPKPTTLSTKVPKLSEQYGPSWQKNLPAGPRVRDMAGLKEQIERAKGIARLESGPESG
ncbi:hypothetical protein IE81DRAFT_325903 [Ceraceosorus guamensis]|uniref:Uncharacterized protein n=1 Tax=Ceraceosorus guamensis TaxID=1522189 RepID=A0A316VRW6_9BASI|nr:hypothetical protein IE81DRAFT_325903 [Ceraceosorus guamensis]PWN40100.1 hypothetical protein IE81DRAFT_325903 [Ceraceosorus guamensis]